MFDFGTLCFVWNPCSLLESLPGRCVTSAYRTLQDCRFENYMAFFFPSQLGDSGLSPEREGGGCRALRDRSGAGSGSHPGQGVGWLNSSKWKLSVPCFSLYCLSAACQVFADRLALFTKTKSQKWRGRGSLVHLYGTPWAPSPTLKTQAVASSQQLLGHARSCCLPD